MIGIIFATISSFFHEVGDSIGKKEVMEKRESLYTMAFLSLFWSIIPFLSIVAYKGVFLFSLASLPTFLVRLFLEIILIHVAVIAITKTERGTWGFLRVITIPLLLAVDIALGYSVSLYAIFGICFIVVSLILLFVNHGIKTEGAWLVVFCAITAVATISLYKYNITNYNSVEAEQVAIHIILSTYFYFLAIFLAKENPFVLMRKPRYFIQSFSIGFGSLFMSFAYLFASASVITSAKRAASVLWSIIFGNIYFHEKKFWLKMLAFSFVVAGLILIAF